MISAGDSADATEADICMARRPLQVLVLPFRYRTDGAIDYAIFRRNDRPEEGSQQQCPKSEGLRCESLPDECWQGVAGGAEDGESAEQAALREMMEETGLRVDVPLVALDTVASIPTYHFRDREAWGRDVYVVPERAFGAAIHHDAAIVLSREHSAYRWVAYGEAARLLRWDSNRTALWELNERLRRGDL